MDNYKIKVKDEAESKEAQELFFELGYKIECFVPARFPRWIATTNHGEDYWYSTSFDLVSQLCGFQELTLPQLRDLAVLKRNDKADGNYKHRDGSIYYITSDNEFYLFDGRAWLKSLIETSEHLIEIENPQPQDPALISGAEALANVHKHIVQYLHDDEPYGRWTTITDHFWSQYHLGMFLDPDTKFKFRFKPQTIKLELEIPAPSKAKIGGRDDTSFVLNIGRHQYCYNNEEDYTKARDALEAVFDAAVRGTNS
ncbi:TPA: hypothetical protein ACGIKB_000806 [Acinetobacter baumannii]|uniref:hypothetical protein n=1 Tax=Acinetobacter baumannii TaxID=470 RepID=UPI00338E4025